MKVLSSSKASGKKTKKWIQKKYWLPIDERLIPDIFAFGSVRGVARIFLIVEFVMVTFVVLGTMVLTFMQMF